MSHPPFDIYNVILKCDLSPPARFSTHKRSHLMQGVPSQEAH